MRDTDESDLISTFSDSKDIKTIISDALKLLDQIQNMDKFQEHGHIKIQHMFSHKQNLLHDQPIYKYNIEGEFQQKYQKYRTKYLKLKKQLNL